ncbi:MAG: hypothetical protein MAG715_00432 [Methanonatronarchaeales archaeon]|nr:hypothetical protein [Methanonatronarchaeales archaeon]
MESCVFCKIVSGKLDAYRVYEDDAAVAFLDLNPVSRGHVLVVPQRHAETVTELSDEEAGELFAAARNVAALIEEGLEPDGLNLLQNNGEAAGQEVRHVHVHVIPRYFEGDGLAVRFDTEALTEEAASRVLETLGQA